MHALCLVYGQVVIDRPRPPRTTEPSICDRARSARTCYGHGSPRAARDRARWADGAVRSAGGDGRVVVEIGGVVDIASRPELIDVLSRAVDSGEPAVIVDLSAVTLLAASGIGCLQTAADLLATRGRSLHLVCPPDGHAARALRLLGLHRVWPLHPDVPTALATSPERP